MSTPTIELTPGQPVYTADGKRLGPIKEVQTGRFKISVRFGRDYWLSCRQVTTSDPDAVVMGFGSDELSEYKLRLIDEERYLEPEADAVISTDEQTEQRERMERELREQRRNLSRN
jgi:hypothetical protein